MKKVKLDPGPIHETMAGQIDSVRPDHLKPGKDIGIEVRDANSITVLVPSLKLRATVEYQSGPDLYAIEILRDDVITSYEGIYCDQLGELIFGEDAKPWSLPMVQVSDDDGENWTVIA